MSKPIQFLPVPGVAVTPAGDRVTHRSVQGTKAARFRSLQPLLRLPPSRAGRGGGHRAAAPLPAPGRAVPWLMSFPDHAEGSAAAVTHGDSVASKAITAQARHFPRTRNSGAVGAEPSVILVTTSPKMSPSQPRPLLPPRWIRVPLPRWEMPPLAPTCVRMEEATTSALPVLVALPGTFLVLQAFGG